MKSFLQYISIEELCQKLSSILDLDEIDAHIYLNLLRMGPVTASALARELHIDEQRHTELSINY